MTAWQVTDELLVPRSNEGPNQIMLQRLQYNGTGEICFSLTQEPPPGDYVCKYQSVIIGSDQLMAVRRFLGGFKP